MSLAGRTIVLGVSGGIAAYKSAELVRELRQAGARVRVIMTRHAQEFITPLTLQTLSGEPVATDLFDLGQESQIGHIDLADAADVVAVAPATANVVAKIAAGLADDLLSTVLLATRAPIVVAPAMNVHMYENPIVQENLARLAGRGVRVVAPDHGSLACGYEGPGRLPDAAVLREEIAAALAAPDLAGETVLVTAGPTREYLDPVRFLSNRSSGKMGFAIARAARRRGARVVVVSGPTALPEPRGIELVRVETAAEMAASAARAAGDATIVIAAAAVADYRPAERRADKEAKLAGASSLALEATPDVVASLPRRPELIVVGFAAETQDLVSRARAKLERKRLDLIVANDVSAEDAGFDVDTNRVTLIGGDGATELPLLAKDDVADAVLDRIREIRGRRPLRVERPAGLAARRASRAS
jgi:phosphopantothenoylcysteine decarboxylase / phosphopantothenate---cysteine ligase